MGRVAWAPRRSALPRRRRGALDAVLLTAAGWVVGLTVTGLILATPFLVFGYRSPSLHLVLNSVDGCVALLLAYLLYGRYLRTGGLRELLLAQGLFLLAVAGLGMTLTFELLGDFRPATVDVWLPLLLRGVGALLVAASAMAGGRHVHRRPGAAVWLAPWLFIVGAFLLNWVSRDQLPVALDPEPPPTEHMAITGHWLLVTTQGVATLCFVVASVWFTAQATRAHQDELLRWLGPACALAAFARLNYLLFPSLYTDWLFTGDVLRTASYLVLLIGAAREIRIYWTAHARAAVLEDRRRLARELHDGVVQEVTFIRGEAALLDGEEAHRIVGAADRALGEARTAIDALGRTPDEPLGFVLHRATRELADRYDGRLEVDVDDSVAVEPSQRQALVRIAREAVSNALRHGRARTVSLHLTGDQSTSRLVVRDDGVGFDVHTVSTEGRGYGLTSMRERAEALPGDFSIDSAPGRGTEVTVSW